MKTALIGQDIPMLLPALLADLLFAGKQRDACLAVEEPNPAMADLEQGYCEAVFRKAGLGGKVLVSADRAAVLSGADCVIYAGDCQPASRFGMDRGALSSEKEDDPGLTDQARVNGGLGGLMHTLRAGEEVLRLCEAMADACPDALVINLGQPMARMTALFERRGFRCFGLGRTPLRGANGLDTILKRLRLKPEAAKAVIAGLPSFAFLLALEDTRTGRSVLPKLEKAAKNNELGSLSRRWLDWWGVLPVGDVTDHAEFLPAQPDYIPEERPEFGESVEKRKERILYMNTVRNQGTESREGAMAQLLLLSKAPPVRPMRLALALFRKETAEIPAVTRLNRGELKGLPSCAVVESALALDGGKEVPHGLVLPAELLNIMTDVDQANRLAAQAAEGDLSALRECVETDPALDGLDRLYCQDVVRSLIALHADVLPRFQDL